MAKRFARPAVGTEMRDWQWLGRCPVCGTSVLVDDEFVRSKGAILHLECDLFRCRRLESRGRPVATPAGAPEQHRREGLASTQR
jgi:hypothetical protein